MTSEEELLIRLGIDTTSLAAGTNKAMDMQKKSSMEYVGFWETALAKKEAAEKAALDASWSRYKANLEKKKAADEIYFATRKAQIEEQAAFDAIAAGSGGAGNTGRVAGALEAGALGTAGAGVAGATKAVAHEAHGFAGIMRETMVLFREGLRGNWTRMIGSATLLIGYIGAMAAAVAIPLAAIVGLPAWHTYKAMKNEKESEDRLKDATKDEGEELRKRIETLQKAGIISEKEATGYNRQLKGGDVMGVLGATNKYLAKGSAEDQLKAVETAREVAKINERERHDELEADRAKMSHLDRIKSLAKEHSELMEKMNGMDMKSVEYAENKVEQARILREMNENSMEIDKETIELQKQYSENRRKGMRIAGEESEIDVEAPSITQLAGRGFMSRLTRAYGKGGRYDLERGDGPFASIAQQAELSKNQEMWDIIHGNAEWQYNTETHKNMLVGGAAFEDRTRRINAENLLDGAGLETPAMKQEKMNADIAEINKNMALLFTAASHDGIKIKTDQ